MKRRISILVDIDHPIDEDELLAYIVNSVTEMRGCYAPDASIHAMKILAAESHKSIVETVDAGFGYGYLGNGKFKGCHQ